MLNIELLYDLTIPFLVYAQEKLKHIPTKNLCLSDYSSIIHKQKVEAQMSIQLMNE